MGSERTGDIMECAGMIHLGASGLGGWSGEMLFLQHPGQWDPGPRVGPCPRGSQSAVMESGPLEGAQQGWGESSRREVPRQPPLEASVGASPGSLGPEHWSLVLVLRGCWKLGLEMLVFMCLLPSSRAQQFAREGEDE